MIEKILDVPNQTIKLNEFDEMTIDQLIEIREEIRLISNKTPEFYEIEEGQINNILTTKKKVTGFDALWASVNIAIAGKHRHYEDYADYLDRFKVYQQNANYRFEEYEHVESYVSYDYDDDYDDGSHSERMIDEYGEDGWEADDGTFFPESWHPGD